MSAEDVGDVSGDLGQEEIVTEQKEVQEGVGIIKKLIDELTVAFENLLSVSVEGTVLFLGGVPIDVKNLGIKGSTDQAIKIIKTVLPKAYLEEKTSKIYFLIIKLCILISIIVLPLSVAKCGHDFMYPSKSYVRTGVASKVKKSIGWVISFDEITNKATFNAGYFEGKEKKKSISGHINDWKKFSKQNYISGN